MIPYPISIRYMATGYITILIVLAVYLISLFVRWRRLRREIKFLEDLELNKEK